MRLVICCVIFLTVNITSAFAEAPAHQSRCEIQSNKYWAIHIHDKPDFKNFKWPDFPPVSSLDAGAPDPTADWHDTVSGITFSVEKDGRHVTATNAAGKLLWRRNPFVDFGMCPYRSPHPFIAWIGAPESGNGPGWHLDSPSTARADSATNEHLVDLYKRIVNAHWPVKPPLKGDRFVGVAFNSSQFGYIDIRNGDYYDGGQN